MLDVPCWRLRTPWGEEIEFATGEAVRDYVAECLEGARRTPWADVPSEAPTRPALVPKGRESTILGAQVPYLLAFSPQPLLGDAPRPSARPMLLVDDAAGRRSALARPRNAGSWYMPASARGGSLPPPTIQLDLDIAPAPGARPAPRPVERPTPSDRSGWTAIGAVLGAGFVTIVSRAGPHPAVVARLPSAPVLTQEAAPLVAPAGLVQPAAAEIAPRPAPTLVGGTPEPRRTPAGAASPRENASRPIPKPLRKAR